GAILLLFAVTVLASPRTVRALLARQLLAEVAIPRSVSVSDRTKPVQPAAEPVTIELAVDGRGPYAGALRIAVEGSPAQRVPLDVEPDDGMIRVKLPAPSGDFQFVAWVGDGRLAIPGQVK